MEDRDAFYCPVEECGLNHGGYCSARRDGLWPQASVFLPMAGTAYDYNSMNNGAAPGPLAGVLFSEEPPLPASPEWRSWRHCPYVHQREH